MANEGTLVLDATLAAPISTFRGALTAFIGCIANYGRGSSKDAAPQLSIARCDRI
jgi:hypothetical protein